jgi:hypothetical protein
MEPNPSKDIKTKVYSMHEGEPVILHFEMHLYNLIFSVNRSIHIYIFKQVLKY